MNQEHYFLIIKESNADCQTAIANLGSQNLKYISLNAEASSEELQQAFKDASGHVTFPMIWRLVAAADVLFVEAAAHSTLMNFAENEFIGGLSELNSHLGI